MSDETVLKIGNIYFPVGSARGISQQLDPIENGELRRTVNAELIDMTRALNRKFRSQISCTDMEVPAFFGLWRGSEVVVECIKRAYQNIWPAADVVTLIRPYVPGSVFGRNQDNVKITPLSIVGDLVTFPAASNCVSVEFRPILTMLVDETSTNHDEYGAEVGWNISLEEK